MIVIPSLHPAFLLRSADGSKGEARFRDTVINDFQKAAQMLARRPIWDEAVIWETDGTRLKNIFPTLQEIYEFLIAARGTFVACDVETSGEEPMNSQLLCIGVASSNGRAICIPILAQFGQRYWSSQALIQLWDLLRWFFTSPDFHLVFQNGAFDTVVLWANRLPVLNFQHDTLLAHHIVDAELPHGLGYIASRYLEVPFWKDDVKGDIRWLDLDDVTLRSYNLRDCLVTIRALPYLLSEVHAQGLDELYGEEVALSKIFSGATVRGIEVDAHRRDDPTIDDREELEDKKGVKRKNPYFGMPKGLGPRLRVQRDAAFHALRTIARDPNFKPRSPIQLKKVLFGDLKFPVVSTTAKGAPATDKNAMVLLTLHAETEDQINFLRALAKFRRADKMLATWVEGLPILWDGRVHASWKVHGTTCVTPDTWVITANGPRQIGKLSGWGPVGSAQPASDDLQLFDGEALQSVSHQVNPGESPTIKITSALGLTIEGPPHHRVLVARRRKFEKLGPRDVTGHREVIPMEPEAVWKRLDAIDESDFILAPFGADIWARTPPCLPEFEISRRRTNALQIQLPDSVSHDLAFFVGLYNADGSLHDANGSFAIRLSCVVRRDRIAAIHEVAVRLFGVHAVRISNEGVVITSIALRTWCAAIGLGRGIAEKCIPEWLLASPRSYVEAYLRGLAFDSSVSVHAGAPRWRYSGSETLCREVQMLLLNMGIVSGVRDVSTPLSPRAWETLAGGSDNVPKICAFTHQPWSGSRIRTRRRRYIKRGNNLWLRVVQIDRDRSARVLDVTVPRTERFWSNGFISHNTGRLSSSPNLQNFPKMLKRIFRAANGSKYVSIDLSQAELRNVGYHARDPFLLDAYKLGLNVHTMNCTLLFQVRNPGIDTNPATELWLEQNCQSYLGTPYQSLPVAPPDKWDQMRRLAKNFEFGCQKFDTPVVTLNGTKPINQIQPGDWTWCWDGKQYVPAQVKRAWSTGVRPCVKITIRDKYSRKHQVTEVILTPNHPMMLRDGTFRPAGELKIGDRLMPFRRFDRVDGYADIDPFNDGSLVREHRWVLPGQEAVHHRNKIKNDNRPENLEGMTYGEHHRHHALEDWSPEVEQRLRESRTYGPAWYASMMKSKVQAIAARKQRGAWCERLRDAPKVCPCGEPVMAKGQCKRCYNRAYQAKRREMNHEVVSIEDAGFHDVWDLEIDHPAHNFAIGAGVFTHNSNYGAMAETLHQVIRAERDRETDELLFADIPLSLIEGLKLTKERIRPAIPRWWQQITNEVKWQGFYKDPLSGRVQWYRGGQKKNEVINRPIQSGVAAHMNKATIRVANRLLKETSGLAGLCIQVHDALFSEAPDECTDTVGKIYVEELAKTFPLFEYPDATLPPDKPKVGQYLDEV